MSPWRRAGDGRRKTPYLYLSHSTVRRPITKHLDISAFLFVRPSTALFPVSRLMYMYRSPPFLYFATCSPPPRLRACGATPRDNNEQYLITFTFCLPLPLMKQTPHLSDDVGCLFEVRATPRRRHLRLGQELVDQANADVVPPVLLARAHHKDTDTSRQGIGSAKGLARQRQQLRVWRLAGLPAPARGPALHEYSPCVRRPVFNLTPSRDSA